MTRRLATLVSTFALVAGLAYASSPLYTSGKAGKSVTSANTTVTFTDNHSGGTNAAFKARTIIVRSSSSSANTCMIDFADGTATENDVPLAPGASLSWPAMSSQHPDFGADAIGVICSAGETATFYIEATR